MTIRSHAGYDALTDDGGSVVAGARPPRSVSGRLARPRSGPVAVAALMALAAVLRLVYVGRAYDLWQDEVNYVDLSVSLRHGHFPPQFASQPFLLHPPLFFALSAGWEMLLHTSGDYFHLVVTVRLLNVICAVISTGLLYNLGTRLGTRVTGIAAALLFACDPYIMRQNGRAMIETSTLMFVLAGYVLIVRLYSGRSRRPAVVAAISGLLLGLSVVSKDMAVVLILVPIAGAFWRRWGMGRRLHAIVFASALIPYAIYVMMLIAFGQFSDFVAQQTGGIQRMLGLEKSTGFTRAGSPSLVHTLVAQLTGFGVTYAICGLGLLAGAYVLKAARRDDQRLLALVTFGGAGTLAYAVVFGTIEEQFLYYLYVPAIVSLAVGAAVFFDRRRTAGPLHRTTASTRAWARGVAAFLAVFVLYDAGLWVHTRSHPDNGMQRMVSFFERHTRAPGVIGNDTAVSGCAEQRAGYQAVLIGSPAAAAADQIRYVTILSVSVYGAYGSLNRTQAKFYETHGQMVFSFHDATYGDIRVYQTSDPSIW